MPRFSIDFALEKGWITQEQATFQKAQARQGGRRIQDDGRRGRVVNDADPTQGHKSSIAEKPPRFVCSIDGDLPQEKLWRACVRRWPGWVSTGRLVWEYKNAVPGRRYRLDIAFPEYRLAVETDGWANHGRHLRDFKRDRNRDRLLTIHGWGVIRFYTKEIHADSAALVGEIEMALQARQLASEMDKR